MTILHIAGYKFTPLNDLPTWRERLFDACQALQLKGTILLSQEGININLAGMQKAIQAFQSALKKDYHLDNLSFHETYAETLTYKRLKVKIKNEIITLRQPSVNTEKRAPSILPLELKKWLDEKRNITLLDTRNDYEFRFGSFIGAQHLQLHDFQELPTKLTQLNATHPIVMFCTGGIRCEKAALYLLNQGFKEIYQLEGGILGYFAKTDGSHYQGECFVFDERIALDTQLNPTGTRQCKTCQGPIRRQELTCQSCHQST
jgi:UPF0176 protein